MTERQRDFLSDLFQTLAERSHKLLRSQQKEDMNATLEELAEALLSTRDESSNRPFEWRDHVAPSAHQKPRFAFAI